MYEQYLFSKNQVFLYGILVAATIGLVFYLFNILTKKNKNFSVLSSFKIFGILAIVLVIIGLQCRTSIYTIDYTTMVYDRTIKYSSALNFQSFDDTEKIGSLQKFMTGSLPDFAKDSLKNKCQLITKMYISLLDDLVNYCNLPSSDTFAISNKTKEFYSQVITNEREKALAASLLTPVIDEINNTKSELYANLRIAKGFAEMEDLGKMKKSIIQNQDKIKNYYFLIFNEQLK